MTRSAESRALTASSPLETVQTVPDLDGQSTADQTVKTWQWFLAVKPGAELRAAIAVHNAVTGHHFE